MYRESFADIIFYIFVKWEKKINKCLYEKIFMHCANDKGY